jgi:hypothetical protein
MLLCRLNLNHIITESLESDNLYNLSQYMPRYETKSEVTILASNTNDSKRLLSNFEVEKRIFIT